MTDPVVHRSDAYACAGTINHAIALLGSGRLAEARDVATQLSQAFPDHPDVLRLLGEIATAGGEPAKAVHYFDAALLHAPGNADALLAKARALLALRERAAACAAAADAARQAAPSATVLWQAGQVFARCDDPATARVHFGAALRAGPDNPYLRYEAATADFFAGDFDAADAHLEASLRALPDAGHALYLRSTLRRQTPARNHVRDLEARLARGFRRPEDQAACLYALAKELEDLADFGRSFAALSAGAALKRKTLRYDAAAERDAIDGIRARLDGDRIAAATHGWNEPGAIFIVGMPRTGTTLVERMLGSHTDVVSAGELPDFTQTLSELVGAYVTAHPGASPVEAALRIDHAELGRRYMATARQAAPGSRIFIDKMPVNFMYCGLIRMALPQARIIHLVRDPMDACYAVYKTLFSQAYFFSYDQHELAAYFATYDRLMRHWHRAMPGAILDVRYEEVVLDTDAQARRLLDWCGLDWQPAVLDPSSNAAPSTTASAAQVREPVHSRSVGAWRRHAEGLAPLAAALRAEGLGPD